ncbi:unnamed protein product [Penicillium pancosmium]
MDSLFHWCTAYAPETHTTAICLATVIWMLLHRRGPRTDGLLENMREDNSVSIPIIPLEESSTSSSSLRRRSQYKIQSPNSRNAVSSGFSAQY